jgi:hypothetical protein
MNKFICKKCNVEYSSLQALSRHENKKFKCDMVTKFQCKMCNKSFKYNKNLQEHIEKTTCNIINIDNNVNKALLDILKNNISIEDKVFFIKNINKTISNDEIIKIINSNFDISTKIILLNTKNTQTIINNNNTTNNNTNNIQINNFGNENLEYINNGYLKNLITNIRKEQNIGGEYLFLKLSNKIFLNDKHPENNTIKIDNLKNDFCKIKNNNKWITSTKDEALKKIFDKVCTIVKFCIDENKEEIEENVFKRIDEYIEKDFEDKQAINAVKKLALDIYNYYNATDV